MATLTIHIPEQQAEALTAKAKAQGLTLEDWLRQVAEQPEPSLQALDWSQCPAVESVPGRVSGAWVFKNTRLPVATAFENLEAGATVEEVSEWFDVPVQEVRDVLEFVTRSLDKPPVFQP